jgi:hypothetical protein
MPDRLVAIPLARTGLDAAMSTFIQTDNDDYINLDRVQKIKLKHSSDAYGRYQFFDHNDRLLGEKHGSGFDPLTISAPIVAAAPDTMAYVVWVDHGDGPEDVDVSHRLVPVAAWRILPNYAEPILVDTIGTNATVLIPMPDGIFVIADSIEFPNLEDAKEFLRDSEIQHRKDRQEAMEGTAKIRKSGPGSSI